MRIIAAFGCLLLLVCRASGQYTDTPTSAWFQSLSSAYAKNCCDQADCHIVESDYHDGSWWAKSKVTGTWVKIDPSQITSTVSIFTQAVLCEGGANADFTDENNFHYNPNIYCFAPPPIGF